MQINAQEKIKVYLKFVYFFCSENDYINTKKNNLLSPILDGKMQEFDFNKLYGIVNQICESRFGMKKPESYADEFMSSEKFIEETNNLLDEISERIVNCNQILKALEKFNQTKIPQTNHIDLLCFWLYSVHMYMNPSLKISEYSSLVISQNYLSSFLQYYFPSSISENSQNSNIIEIFKITISESISICVQGLPNITKITFFQSVFNFVFSEIFLNVEVPENQDDEYKFYSIISPAVNKTKNIDTYKDIEGMGTVTLDDILFISNKIDKMYDQYAGNSDKRAHDVENEPEKHKKFENVNFKESKISYNDPGKLKSNFMCVYDTKAFEKPDEYHIKRLKLQERIEKRREVSNIQKLSLCSEENKDTHIKKRSNRHVIRNALIYYVFAVKISNSRLEEVLAILDNEASSHFLILFSDRNNFKLQFRGLYTFQSSSGCGFKIYGLGPSTVSDERVENLYTYENSSKVFKHIPLAKNLSIAFDAFSLKRTKL